MFKLELIAHRGLPKLYPENTASSLSEAVGYKPAQIEIDVQRSRDGIFTVFHDFNIVRLTGIDSKLRDMSFSELERAPVYFDGKLTDQKILSLDEVLDLLPPEIMLNIEIKRETEEEYIWEKELVEKILAKRSAEQFILSSINHECLYNVWQVSQELKLGVAAEAMLIDTVAYLKNLPFNVYSYHPCIDYVSEKEVSRLHEAGYKVFPWPVDTDADMAKMIASGADAVMTNDVPKFTLL